MPVSVEKKTKAEERHREAAKEFRQWLDENPDATPDRKVFMFDAVCDAIFYRKHKK